MFQPDSLYGGQQREAKEKKFSILYFSLKLKILDGTHPFTLPGKTLPDDLIFPQLTSLIV
jgi:hypothetical protein